MIKRYNYRAYPTKEQDAYFQQVFGQCRFVYNWGLGLMISSYEESKERGDEKPKGLSTADVSKRLTQLKKESDFAWLNEGPSACHGWALEHLKVAFKNFFKGSGYPKFKSKHKSQKSFSFHQGYKIEGNKISVPKSGWLKFVKHRDFEGTTKTVTVKQEPSGKYYISVVVDDGKPALSPLPENRANIVGIDVGVINAATLSDGMQFHLGIDLSNDDKKMMKAQKKLSRKEKGSNNYRKQRIRLAKKHESMRLKREYAIKMTAFDLVNYLLDSKYSGIAIRNYDIKEMTSKEKDVKKDENGNALKGERQKRRKLNKKNLSGAMGMLCDAIKRKCDENGIHVYEFEAYQEKTTAKCFICTSEDVDISLKSRLIRCKCCGHIDDIDRNASKNVKKIAL